MKKTLFLVMFLLGVASWTAPVTLHDQAGTVLSETPAVLPLPLSEARKIVLQATAARYDANQFEPVENPAFSDGHGLRSRQNNGELSFTFRIERDGDYQLRSSVASPCRDMPIYAKFRLDDQPPRRRVVFPAWRRGAGWEKLTRLPLKAGQHTLHVRIPQTIALDCLTLEPMSAAPEAPEAARKYRPTIAPPAEHPRLLLTPETIPTVRANLKQPENVAAAERVRSRAAEPLQPPRKDGVTVYDRTHLLRIEARAFLYALEGDRRHAREAVDAMRSYLADVDFDNLMDVTRLLGHTIFVASEVYDWCYPLLTNAEKAEFRTAMLRLGQDSEIGWPPFQQSVINGHGNESQLSRDFLSMGIALYDEDPEPYRLCAYRIFEEMVPAHNYEYRSGRHTQGTNYGPCRFSWDLHLAMTFRIMARREIFSADFNKVPYFWLYMLLPNEELFDDTDVFFEHGTPYRYGEPTFNMFAWTGDPLLKRELLRQNALPWISNYMPVQFLIFNRPEVVAAEDFTALPQTRFFPEPLSSMIARTGWEFGPASRTAVVEMKAAPYNRHDHQHMDAGGFQIFYRAPLAVDLGVYGHWGQHYDFTFAKRTIPHNAMLVYDPEEIFAVQGNDGGQRFVKTMPWTIRQVIDHPEIHSTGTLAAHYVGPDARQPLFSHIKGDIAAAYNPHKMKEYQRNFVFSRLDDPQTPALLIVFDHVVSTRPEFRKYFLLNTLTRPKFGDGIIRVENRLPGGSPGELFVTTLLPRPDNVERTAVGDGKALEFFGNKVEMPPRNQAQSRGWRTMLSPKTPSAENRFLHVMLIGEPQAVRYPVEFFESGSRIGVRAAGRIVMFSNSGKATAELAKFTVPADRGHQVLLTDLLPGEYAVQKDGKPFRNAIVKPEEQALQLTAPAGTIWRIESVPTGK